MVPTWMIEELKRQRREHWEQEREQPRLEVPSPLEESTPPESDFDGPIVIEF